METKQEQLPGQSQVLKQNPTLNQSLAHMRKKMVRGISDYSMIDPHDKILVAVSGGKDSSLLLLLLNEVQKKARIPFSIHPVLLDQKQPGFDASLFADWVTAQTGQTLKILEEDTYSVVVEKTPVGKTMCALCSRLRRGILYSYAAAHGYTKIALGHHADDMIETLLLNLFYGGKIASMPPKLYSDDGRNTVIRPLVYVHEAEIEALKEELRIPVIPCRLCGSQEGLKRQKMKELVAQLQQTIPFVAQSMLAALQDVRPSQLHDIKLWTERSGFSDEGDIF